MNTTVYIDALFIENFLIDFLVLYMTAFVMCTRTSFLRMTVSSFSGSFYMCSLYFNDFPCLKNTVFKIIVFCAMLFIAFPIKSFRSFVRYMMTFLFINFFLGGCIYFFASISGGNVKNGVFYIKTELAWLILGGLTLIFIGRFFIMLFKKNMTTARTKKELTVVYKNKKMKLSALSDTGNTLIDPISKKPVVVVTPDKIRRLVNEEKLSGIKNFRLIPCRTVTDKYELLYGFKPDRIIYKDKEIDAVIAISKCDFDADYDAVINPLTLI